MPKFHPDCCLNCGYSLHGLPTAHRCPECGTPYDEHVTVWRPARPWKIFLAGIIFQIYIVLECLNGIAFLGLNLSRKAWQVLLVVASCIWLAALVRGLWIQHRGLRVWIEPRGVGVRDATRDTLIPWHELLSAALQGAAHRRTVRLKCESGSFDVEGVFASSHEALDFWEELEQARRRYDPNYRAAGSAGDGLGASRGSP